MHLHANLRLLLSGDRVLISDYPLNAHILDVLKIEIS